MYTSKHLVATMLAGILLFSAGFAANAEVSVDAVLTAWGQRQDRAKRLKFKWREERFQAKGSIPLPPEPRYEGVVFPAKNTVYHVDENECTMDGMMMRYSYRGESLQFYNKGKLEIREYVSASDLKDSKIFFSRPNELRPYPKGIILNQETCEDISSINVRPLLYVYRGTEPMVGVPIAQISLSAQKGLIGKTNCLIVNCPRLQVQYAFWVDPDREFLPLRVTAAKAATGHVESTVDISYKKDDMHGWVPIGWKIVRSRKQPSEFSVTAQVIEYAIDVDIPRSEFQIEFPPGTIVTDMRKRDQRHLVRDDGSERIISVDETIRGATYEQIKNTETGLAGITESRISAQGWMLIMLGVVAVIGAAVCFKARGYKFTKR